MMEARKSTKRRIIMEIDLERLSVAFAQNRETPLTPEEKDLLGRVKLQTPNLITDLSSYKPILSHSSTGDSTETKTHNVTFAMLQYGILIEQSFNADLQKHASEASEIQQTIEKLIDVSGKLAVHMEGDGERVLSDEIQSLCQDLKDKGIEVLQGKEGKVSRDRMAEIKAHISSHTDRLKTDLQKKFTTEIQVKINELHSILDCLKTMEKYASRLNSTIVSNQRPR
jgi:ElaB/YqjD/DUF883 family membrane-anchored ribosome-binding protein